MNVIRISIGDFQFDSSNALNDFENRLFWIIWMVIVLVTCIVFLNFIIAEVSASYQQVKDHIDVLVEQEKATLISESEDMLKARYGGEKLQEWTHFFPRYIITREEED